MDETIIKIWNNIDANDKLAIFRETGEQAGLPASAIEKDWWVTIVLHIVFSLSVSKYIVFKGGTSLSKGWNLIERFSEDIDLALDREFLGFEGDLSKTQVKKLRKASCSYISTDLVNTIAAKTDDLGIPGLTIGVQDFKDSDTDPLVISLNYESLPDNLPYLPPRVLIEISARSLMEPSEERKIQSMVGKRFSDRDFADMPMLIPTVLPQRTFLEKAFLLHEEFQKPAERVRVDRMSRHLYDLDKLSETGYATDALNDPELYDAIVIHREKFNPIRGIDYANHQAQKIDFIPPEGNIKRWENDYRDMQESMIYGDSKKFTDLIKSLEKLKERFRKMA